MPVALRDRLGAASMHDHRWSCWLAFNDSHWRVIEVKLHRVRWLSRENAWEEIGPRHCRGKRRVWRANEVLLYSVNSTSPQKSATYTRVNDFRPHRNSLFMGATYTRERLIREYIRYMCKILLITVILNCVVCASASVLDFSKIICLSNMIAISGR